MPRQYDNAFARCPFFLSSDRKTIMCQDTEGTEEVIYHLIFPSEGRRNLHRRLFCDANFKKCGICKLLEEKYEK